MNGISDQLSGSFDELMQEIRAMRKELEGIRRALEEREPSPGTKRTTHGSLSATAGPQRRPRARKQVA